LEIPIETRGISPKTHAKIEMGRIFRIIKKDWDDVIHGNCNIWLP
jgi:hypothetical protein